jgi:DNA-directed RNA polymerase subunit RPC12/RpoP
MSIEVFDIDTSEFPSIEEIDVINKIETNNGWIEIGPSLENTVIERIYSLAEKGFLFFYSTGSSKTYACLSNHHNCRLVSVCFYAYRISIGVNNSGETKILNDEEINKMRFMRKLVAEWVLHKEHITNEEYKLFLRIFTSNVPFILSIPVFLMNEFEELRKKTGIEITQVSPEFSYPVCQMCRTSFETIKKQGFTICPGCGMNILIR